jgi:hypothetical protein
MEHDWILDVLADLRNYASRNDLPALAEQLQETALLAAVEISSVESGDGSGMKDDARRFRNHSRPLAAGDLPRRAAS